MGWFGGSSPKPMTLFSNATWVQGLERYRTTQSSTSSGSSLCVRTADPYTGDLRPRGGPELKESQAYTPEFGTALATLFSNNRAQWRNTRAADKVCTCGDEPCPSPRDMIAELTSQHLGDTWPDANLQGILASLRARALSLGPDILSDVVDLDAA
jgi:hypothetical protein